MPAHTGAENGIGVGDAKVFDNRSLVLMLEGLNESLRAVQIVDSRTLAASLNLLQGYQQESVARSFTVQGAPLPGIVETAKSVQQQGASSSSSQSAGSSTNPPNTTSSESAGGTSTSGTTQEASTQTTTAARSPVNPDLPQLLSGPSFAAQFGTSGSDLLSDQVNLTYQIFNVRMLLERALSDRLIGNNPRLQAVLGFNISIDPPRDSQDSAAFVEVSVRPRDRSINSPVSVVALMPQEKTYNSAALSNRSTAFGGSAVAQVFSVGYSERRQSQLFYLFRDNDTISFQRMNPARNETTFGWSFRPVLGRRSVSPGLRQMFAVVSLPAEDVESVEISLDVEVRTYWRHYDRRTLTTSDSRTFWQGVAHAASLGIGQDRPAKTDARARSCVSIPTTQKFQDDLTPAIEAIDWRQTDDRTAIVSVRGKNFFQGTTVRIGSSLHAAPGDGLQLKSDRAFDLVVPVTALLGNGVIAGRYGNVIEMRKPKTSGGLELKAPTFAPAVGGRRVLTMTLTGPNNGALSRADLPLPVLISMGGTVVPPPYDIQEVGNHVKVTAFPAVDQFPNVEGLLTVLVPFAGPAWQRTVPLHDASLAFTVSRFGADGTTTKLLVLTNDTKENPFMQPCALSDADRALIDGVPPPNWTVTLGKTYTLAASAPTAPGEGAWLHSPQYIEIRAATDAVDRHPLLLTDCLGTVHRLVMPAAPAARPPAPALTSVTPAVVKRHDARRVTITGSALDRVASVTANDLLLASRVIDGGTKLEVFLVAKLTDQARVLTLICRDDKGAILGSIDVTVQ